MRKTEWHPRLGLRQASFEYMVQYFCDNLHTGRNLIVETGTARAADAWETDGQSTQIWDWVAGICEDVDVLSIDLNPQAIANAKSQTLNVEYRCGDSLQELALLRDSERVGRVGLLYLDSCDWDIRHKYLAAGHALQELHQVWRALPSGCLVAVDDMHTPDFGKHAAIAEIMADLKIPANVFDYQICWVKP